jgi:hypothetical protein
MRAFLMSNTVTTEPCIAIGTGEDQGSPPRAHQQAQTTSPFDNTCEADSVSLEAVIRGLQDRDVYNQRKYQVDLIQTIIYA